MYAFICCARRKPDRQAPVSCSAALKSDILLGGVHVYARRRRNWFVGQQIALALQRRTGQVRGFVRGGASNPKATELVAAGVEVAPGDLTRPDTLVEACTGIETVICTATTMPSGADDGPRRVDHQGVLALIDAAEGAGVKKCVYTSYSGNNRIDCALHTAKRDCEARLLNSRMEAVILRPLCLMEL